jgi:hypothetical protein
MRDAKRMPPIAKLRDELRREWKAKRRAEQRAAKAVEEAETAKRVADLAAKYGGTK